MLGYWSDPSHTKNVLKNGYLYTGDIGFKDKDGDVVLIGRKEDFIKIGGNRVSLAQV
jgi:long-subunit acyl-CoA synthetase (AMP-forming)